MYTPYCVGEKIIGERTKTKRLRILDYLKQKCTASEWVEVYQYQRQFLTLQNNCLHWKTHWKYLIPRNNACSCKPCTKTITFYENQQSYLDHITTNWNRDHLCWYIYLTGGQLALFDVLHIVPQYNSDYFLNLCAAIQQYKVCKM